MKVAILNLNICKQRSFLIAVILSSMMLVQLLSQGSFQFIQISAGYTIVLISIISIFNGHQKKTNLPVLFFYIIFASMIIFSAYRSAEDVGASSLIRGGAIVACLFCGLFFAAIKDSNLLEDTVVKMSAIFLIILIVVLIDNDRHWTRLAGHLYPNLWSFLAATFAPGALFLKTRPIWKSIIILAYFYLILFEFQTRGSFVWSAFVILLFMCAYFTSRRHFNASAIKRFSILLAIGVTAVAMMMFFGQHFLLVVLDIDSTTRGLNSGLSGRTVLWANLFNEYLESPLIGHGLDSSRIFVYQKISEDLGSAHNTYLTVLFEFGFLGFTLYFLAVILSLWGAYKHKKFALLAFLLVYTLSGLTESRPLNVGNPSSLLFLFLLPYCTNLAIKPVRRL